MARSNQDFDNYDFRTTMTDLFTQPMGKRVDTESGLLDKGESKNACIHQTTLPITPTQASYQHWKQHPEHQNGRSIMPVLPDNNRILVQIRDIRSSLILGILLQDHPHEMRIPNPLHNTVRIFRGIRPSMMRSVFTAPPPNGPLHRTSASTSQENPERKASNVKRQHTSEVSSTRLTLHMTDEPRAYDIPL
jgi:hypothetical protein